MSARRPKFESWGLPAHVLAAAGAEVVNGDLTRIPYRTQAGEVHNARLIAPDGRCWWEETGKPLIPLGLRYLTRRASAAQHRALVICEGESDYLALIAALWGRSTPPVCDHDALGLPGARTWRDEWAEFLSPYELIYVVGDADQAGRAMMEKVVGSVRWARPVHLSPEGTDARQLLQTYGPRALDRFFDEADRDAALRAAWRRPTLEAAQEFLAGVEAVDRGR